MKNHKSSITFVAESGDYLLVVRDNSSFWYRTKKGSVETEQQLSFVRIIKFTIDWISKHKSCAIVPID